MYRDFTVMDSSSASMLPLKLESKEESSQKRKTKATEKKEHLTSIVGASCESHTSDVYRKLFCNILYTYNTSFHIYFYSKFMDFKLAL